MDENNTIDFNAAFEKLIGKVEKREEAERNHKPYVDTDEIEEKKMIQDRINHYEEISTSVKNYFPSQLEDFKQKVQHTKFKKRTLYELNDQCQEIKFLLDNKVIFQLDYEDFLLNYNNGDLADKVIEQLYVKENFYTLKDFVETQCYISKTTLEPRFRINYDEFVFKYILYAENKFGPNKLVNLKRIARNLEDYFNCRKIKYNNTWQLSNITDIKYFEEQSKKSSNYTPEAKDVFVKFINEFCEIFDYVEPHQRVKRSDFKKVYTAYLVNKNMMKCRLNNNELKDILITKYKECFIKSNGIWYMKKIKFKNFGS